MELSIPVPIFIYIFKGMKNGKTRGQNDFGTKKELLFRPNQQVKLVNFELKTMD